MTTSDKNKALDIAIGQIEQHFGTGAVMKLGEMDTSAKVDGISTGSLSLDMALGTGGIPRGRITEVFGTESSGKSTLAYHVMASSQKAGGTVAYIDAEHALDPYYAANVASTLMNYYSLSLILQKKVLKFVNTLFVAERSTQ